jgi:hypothetical protein
MNDSSQRIVSIFADSSFEEEVAHSACGRLGDHDIRICWRFTSE